MPGAEPYSHDGGDVGVLLCHGFTGCPQSLRPWAEHHAAAGLTVRLPRLPGHGTRWQELNMTRWEDWYACAEGALLELTARCRAVVVGGLSMGGALALRLAQEHGPAVAGLVVVNPAVRVEDRRLVAVPVLRHLLPSIPGIGNDIAKPGADELPYDRVPLKALSSLLELQKLVRSALVSVTVPLLQLTSRQDHVVEPANAQIVSANISSTDFTQVWLERSYHVATLDYDADLIVRHTTDFVERVTAPSAARGK